MTVSTGRLNRELAAQVALADRDLLPLYERAYGQLITRAGKDAAAALESPAVVAAGEWQPPPEAGEWQPPPESILFSAVAFAALAAEKLRPLHRRALRLITGETLARVGISWTIAHPVTQEMLAASGKRTGVRLGEAVQPVIRAAVEEAYEQGLSVWDAAKLIRDKVADARPWQAEMLARTDLNGLANGGSVAAATLAGAEFKQWLTAHDDRVREQHVEADGQTVPVDQPFNVCDGEELDFPGDPAGTDGCTANCRCTVIYVDAAEAAPAAVAASGGDEMARTAAVTVTVDEETSTAVAWHGDLAFEGVATSDGRYILLGALRWRELPLSLGMMRDTPHADLVTDSRVVGRIDRIFKSGRDMDGEQLAGDVKAVRGAGVFDTGDDGQEAARLVGDEVLRGVSVDLAVDDWAFRDPDTGELYDPEDLTGDLLERAMFGDLQMAVKSGEIMASTICPTAAFADARIAVVASAGRPTIRLWAPIVLAREALTAAAAGLAPVKPPADWFSEPEAGEPTPLTVTSEGRVFGHIALWDSCHTGMSGVCRRPEPSQSGYAYFNLGEVESADGTRFACGQITMGTGHASLDPRTSPKQVLAHYDDTGTAAADVRASDGHIGIWVAGAVRPDLSEHEARTLMGAKPSGDWRQISPGGPLELVGVLAVNVPGFPVPRPQLALVASAEHPEGDVVALVAAGGLTAEEYERRVRVLAARAGGVEGLAELAGV